MMKDVILSPSQQGGEGVGVPVSNRDIKDHWSQRTGGKSFQGRWMVCNDLRVNKKDVNANKVIYNSLYYNFYHNVQQKSSWFGSTQCVFLSTQASNCHLFYPSSPVVFSASERQTSLKDMSFGYHLFGEVSRILPLPLRIPRAYNSFFPSPSIPTHGGVRIIVKIDAVLS